MQIFRLFIVSFIMVSSPVEAAELITPFAGSTALGEHNADFVKYHYLPSAADDVAPATAEGRIHSRLFEKPEAKSNFEVIKSFEQELKAAGFTIEAFIDDTRRGELLVRQLNGAGKNDMVKRPYTGPKGKTSPSVVARIATQAQQYVAARKTIDQTDVLIVVYTSRSGGYAIDQIESAAMEAGTVALNLDALRDRIANDGRIAIYGIRFDTGSALIRPESEDTLAIIVAYLEENAQTTFYVVGHTDDEGGFESNMTLSRARADAVVKAVVERLPSAAARLQADGVGPLSPVATNSGKDGRQLNRRVELVSRVQ